MIQNWGVYALTGSYQNVVSPAFLGKVQRCLFELHNILIATVSPVLGPQLTYIGPVQINKPIQASVVAPKFQKLEKKNIFKSTILTGQSICHMFMLCDDHLTWVYLKVSTQYSDIVFA